MIKKWVRDMVEQVLPQRAKVGDVIEINGRKAKITSGQYWGTYGLSNHWHWKYLDKKKPRTGNGYL